MKYRITSTKIQAVHHMWLKGISRDKIAHSVNIGYGSVSRIIDKIRSTEIPDLDMLRLIAVKIKDEGFSLVDVASAIRLKNFLKNMGSSEEELEKLLLEMEIYGYKTSEDFDEIIGIFEKIKDFELDFDISIRQLPDFLEQKKQELYQLENEIMRKTLFPDENIVDPQPH